MGPRTIYPVIGIKPTRGGGSQVVIQVGSKVGVNRSWKANLVDKEERPIPRGELKIDFVDAATTTTISKLRLEEIPRDVQAQVRPL